MDDMTTGSSEMAARHVHEQPAFARHGALGSLIGAALLVGGLAIGLVTARGNEPLGAAIIGVTAVVGLVVLRGLVTIAPGEARVLQFFGRYVGTVRADGLRWVNPFASRRKVSTRVRNHETATSKVNDADGNPIEIAAVVVWRVEDTAQALFEVDNFVAFVETQTETAVRHIATSYPYDTEQSARGALWRPVHPARRQRGIPLPVRWRCGGPQAVPAPTRPRCPRRGRPLGFRRPAQRERSDRVLVAPGARQRRAAAPRCRHASETWPPASRGRRTRAVDLPIVPCGIPPGRKAARRRCDARCAEPVQRGTTFPTPESRAHPWPT